MSEVSMGNLNRVQYREGDYTQRGVSKTIKQLEDAQKVNAQKQATGREYTSYSEMSMGSAEQSLTLASDLSTIISANAALDTAKSDINDLSNGIGSVIKLTQSFKQDILRFQSSANKHLNQNAMIKTVAEFKSTLQAVLNSRSSWKGDYIFSGQKIESQAVDLSAEVDIYYQGSEFNKKLSLYHNEYELSFNAGDKSIKSLVEVINLMEKGIETGFGRVLEKLDRSISDLTASKYQIDSTDKNMVDFSTSLREKFIGLNNRFQEINDVDQTQIILEFQKTKVQLNAIGASQKYVSFEMANYL